MSRPIGDYDGQMIFGDIGGLKLLTFVLQVRKNPEKTSPRKLVPTGDRTRARCVTDAHATTCSTAVDFIPSKTATLVPEFAVEDLPVDRTAT